jgi:aminobenzoyl-glutamate utilization protein B
VQAMTLLDAIMRPDVLAQAREYFENVQTKERKYTPLIRPQDKPAVHLNKAIMDRYRPEMKKYYYDPTKYKTYLEQLGITYPTVRGSQTANAK